MKAGFMEKQIELVDILEELYEKLDDPEALSEIEKEKILEKFWKYYQEKKRHYYHEVTHFIFEKESILEGALGEQTDLFSSVIKDLADLALQKGELCTNTTNPKICINEPKLKCEKAKQKGCYYYSISKSLNKLYDHIQLEIARLGKIRDANNSLKNELEKAQNNLNNLDEKANELDNNIIKIQERAKNTQKEYITILGIFSAVVLAFIGGMIFSTSVLQNIGNGSIFRILAAVLVIAFTFLNMIYLLIRFITDINNYDGNFIKYSEYMKWINKAILCMILIISIGWLIDIHRIAEFFQLWLYQ